jgi:hypothetical protein
MRTAPLSIIAAAAAVVACASLSPSVVHAESARAIEGERKVESASLGADAAASRAVIDVRLARRFATGKEVRAAAERVSVALPELVLDTSAREIVLVESGRRVVCATVDGENVKETGSCRIVATIEPRSVDTGGRSLVRDHLVVRVEPR